MKILSCMKTTNMATLKKETPAKPVIAGKLMLKGQKFQGNYTKIIDTGFGEVCLLTTTETI